MENVDTGFNSSGGLDWKQNLYYMQGRMSYLIVHIASINSDCDII